MSDKMSEVEGLDKDEQRVELDGHSLRAILMAREAVFTASPNAGATQDGDGWWRIAPIHPRGSQFRSSTLAFVDAASKLTPAAVAGDATRVTWRLDKISFDRPYSYNHCEENTARCAFDSTSLGNAVTSVHLVKITTTEEIVESRNV